MFKCVLRYSIKALFFKMPILNVESCRSYSDFGEVCDFFADSHQQTPPTFCAGLHKSSNVSYNSK